MSYQDRLKLKQIIDNDTEAKLVVADLAEMFNIHPATMYRELRCGGVHGHPGIRMNLKDYDPDTAQKSI